jgi:hypothetical protein
MLNQENGQPPETRESRPGPTPERLSDSCIHGPDAHSRNDAKAQPSPALFGIRAKPNLGRSIYVRHQGDGFRAEVEPHPRTKKGEAGFNRRFACLTQARDYGRGLSDAKGWPFVDECAGIKAEPLANAVRPLSALTGDELAVNRLVRLAFRQARSRRAGDPEGMFGAALDAFAAGHVREGE